MSFSAVGSKEGCSPVRIDTGEGSHYTAVKLTNKEGIRTIPPPSDRKQVKTSVLGDQQVNLEVNVGESGNADWWKEVASVANSMGKVRLRNLLGN